MENAASMILDTLKRWDKSVLLLGPPGSGKTTVLRDAARILSDEERLNVVVVDTANEIGGDGVVPHRSVGMARRMMVPHKSVGMEAHRSVGMEAQADVLLEAVRNHRPDVIAGPMAIYRTVNIG